VLLIELLTAVVLGGVLGTLVNMVATRLPEDLPLAGPPLRTMDRQPERRGFIPYVGARDAATGRIDWPNLGAQLSAAVLAGVAFVLHGFSWSSLEAIVLTTILLVILRIDWQHHLIFMLTIWPGVLVALLFSLRDSREQFVSSLVAGLAAAGAFLLLYFLAILIYRKRALGLGDVFLAGLIGTMVGLQFVTITLLAGMFVAALGGLLLVALHVRSRKDYIPYGAYLSAATIVMVLLIG
jgi:leader peptidase (prepilin peptidase)/N-methyltransferase